MIKALVDVFIKPYQKTIYSGISIFNWWSIAHWTKQIYSSETYTLWGDLLKPEHSDSGAPVHGSQSSSKYSLFS